jgi:LPS-assembly protein
MASLPAWAAPAAPITLEADNLYYNDQSGEFQAQGSVKIHQENKQITADNMNGNAIQGSVKAEGHIRWQDDVQSLQGEKLEYNYKTQLGNIGKTKGNIDGILVSGDQAVLQPKSSVLYNAAITKCPAQIPDYKLTASKIDIYPGEKIVANHASLWIKNTKLLTVPKVVQKLGEESSSAFPVIGYNSSDGAFVKQELELPLKNGVSLTGELAYYTKRKFTTQLGLDFDKGDLDVNIAQGKRRNADGEWYKQEPELTIRQKAKEIKGTDLLYSYKLQAGRISEEVTDVAMDRRGAVLSLERKPITLGNNTTLRLGTSYEYNWYESHEDRNILRGTIGLEKKLSETVAVGLGYTHVHETGSTPFIYDKVDVYNELTSKATWNVDHLWQVGVSTSYDIDNSRFADVDYTIKRNLHCFEASVTYREKRDEWNFKMGVLNW